MGGTGCQYRCPYRYTQLFPKSTGESAKVPWRERTSSHQHGGHTWNQVYPSPKYQKEIRSVETHQSNERKTDNKADTDVAVCKHCDSVVKLVGGTSNTWAHMKRHHPLLLFGSRVGNKRKADMLVHMNWYANILYRYEHRIAYWYVLGVLVHRSTHKHTVRTSYVSVS